MKNCTIIIYWFFNLRKITKSIEHWLQTLSGFYFNQSCVDDRKTRIARNSLRGSCATDLLPSGSDFAHGRIIKVDPHSQLGVEEECRVVFAVVGDNAHQLMRSGRGGGRSRRGGCVEHVAEAQAGAQRAQQGHDVLQRRALWVPYYADTYDLRPVGQRSADLNLCSTGTLVIKREKLVVLFIACKIN